ncbi:MAG: ATP-binding protein [Chloroflexi bacterium]|nr:ATP-binding protein [Chloroflexota bacterium]MBU1752087.1 ATP-binding protein [Chloroflexota bacterium]
MSEPLLVIVTGPPGAGTPALAGGARETTLARRIARDLGLPLFARDDFKEILFDSLGWSDRAWSRQVGRASWQILYHAMEELLRAGQSLVVESNFYREYAEPEFAALQGRHRFQTVQVVCQADEDTLLRRFQQRAASGERHPGHVDEGNLDEFRDALRRAPWGVLDIAGRVVYVDTTDFGTVDYNQILGAIRPD